jgi:hypothetical protein
MANKIYKVMAYCSYKDNRNTLSYCVGKFTTKKEARECLKRQYDTPSRSHTIEEVIEHVPSDLPTILKNMANYVKQCIANGEDVSGYFGEITNCGLFEDSEGKVVFRAKSEVQTSIDY